MSHAQGVADTFPYLLYLSHSPSENVALLVDSHLVWFSDSYAFQGSIIEVTSLIKYILSEALQSSKFEATVTMDNTSTPVRFSLESLLQRSLLVCGSNRRKKKLIATYCEAQPLVTSPLKYLHRGNIVTLLLDL